VAALARIEFSMTASMVGRLWVATTMVTEGRGTVVHSGDLELAGNIA
jgi:hypothetical protein